MPAFVEWNGNKNADYICKDGTRIPLIWEDLCEDFYTPCGVKIPEYFVRGYYSREYIETLKKLIEFVENN